MSWAESRKTTEPEDAAYCQLGILYINMPLSYGEGKERALQRLLEEIEANRNTPSIIPFSQNDRFVGRESQVTEIERKLFSEKLTTKLAIMGRGGIGKSQLALELAHRTKRRDKSCSVFWIDASNIDSLYQSYSHIAEKLQILGKENEKEDIMQLVKQYLSGKNARHWLLILDNANDVDLGFAGLSAARYNLIDYLPQSGAGSIIFTTSNNVTARMLASENIVELQEVTQDMAQIMLENHLVTRTPPGEHEKINLLLRELSYLPLAIVQAAAYINKKGLTIDDYLSLLAAQKEECSQFNNKLTDESLQDCEKQSPITLTLLVSLKQIRHDHCLAANYMFLMACIDWKDIPLDFLSPATFRERGGAAGDLNDYGLITRRPAVSALDVHRLVHSTVRMWLTMHNIYDQWHKEATRHLVKLFPGEHYGNRSKWRRLLPHAKYALSYGIAEQENEASLSLAWKCAIALSSDGRWDEAEELQVQVRNIRRRVLGVEHSDTLDSMAHLALTYRNKGWWDKAEELEVQVMEIRKRVLGTEHRDSLTCISNLALTYCNKGLWEEAEKLGVQVMKIRLKLLGAKHPDTLISMGNLASIYIDKGRWNEAEELELKVMEIRQKILGAEHPDTLTSMGNLASTYCNKGQWDEAENLEVQVMDIRKRMLGAEHPQTLSSMNNLASTYLNKGLWDEAETLGVQVVETSKSVLGVEHPNTLRSIANLAITYLNKGHWDQAEMLQAEVLDTSKRVLGLEHPETLSSIANLGTTYMIRGRWNKAEELFIQMTETTKRVLGVEHPSTLSSISNLATIYSKKGRRDEAEELEVQVMETSKRALGGEHPDTLTRMANLASTYTDQGRWKEAEELEAQVIETEMRVLGDEHPNTLISIANLASTYRNQGRWKEAEELEAQVMETRKRLLGDEHPDTLISMNNLAFTLRGQGFLSRAISLMEDCCMLQTSVQGPQHPYTISSREALTTWRLEAMELSKED